MLNELKEIDVDIWAKYQHKIHNKWLGKEVEDDAAGGGDAGGGGDDDEGDDGGDDDDE